jgi:hypothetical protein
MKIQPIFNTEFNLEFRKEARPNLSEAAQYAKELYQDGYKMLDALFESARFYRADIHKIARELGIRGGKVKKGR